MSLLSADQLNGKWAWPRACWGNVYSQFAGPELCPELRPLVPQGLRSPPSGLQRQSGPLYWQNFPYSGVICFAHLIPRTVWLKLPEN